MKISEEHYLFKNQHGTPYRTVEFQGGHSLAFTSCKEAGYNSSRNEYTVKVFSSVYATIQCRAPRKNKGAHWGKKARENERIRAEKIASKMLEELKNA